MKMSPYPLQNLTGVPEERKSLSSEAELCWAVAAIFCPPGTLLLATSPAFGSRQGKGGKENNSLGRGSCPLPGQCGWRSRCVPWGLPLSSLGTVVVGEGCRALPMEKGQALPEESHPGDEGGKYSQSVQLLSGLLPDTA